MREASLGMLRSGRKAASLLRPAAPAVRPQPPGAATAESLRRRGRSGGPRKQHHTLTGTLVVSRPGAAHVETPEGDFELVRHGQREAMNGDEVEVAIIERRGRAPRAVVRSVIIRAVETFLGTYAVLGPLGAVRPLDARIGHDFFVVPEDPSPERLGVGEGDVVVARITEYPTRKSSAVVTLERRVGAAGEVDGRARQIGDNVALDDRRLIVPGHADGERGR